MNDTSPRVDDSTRRIIEALERAAVRARRVAAQTGTPLAYVRDGERILEEVPYDDPAARPTPPPVDP